MRIVHLCEQHALRFELQCHPVSDIIHKLLQFAEFDSAQRPPVLPVNEELQLSTLLQLDGEPLVPGLLTARFPVCPRNFHIVKFEYSRYFI